MRRGTRHRIDARRARRRSSKCPVVDGARRPASNCRSPAAAISGCCRTRGRAGASRASTARGSRWCFTSIPGKSIPDQPRLPVSAPDAPAALPRSRQRRSTRLERLIQRLRVRHASRRCWRQRPRAAVADGGEGGRMPNDASRLRRHARPIAAHWERLRRPRAATTPAITRGAGGASSRRPSGIEPVYLIARRGGAIAGVLPLVANQEPAVRQLADVAAVPELRRRDRRQRRCGAALLVAAARDEAHARRCAPRRAAPRRRGSFPTCRASSTRCRCACRSDPALWEALDRKVRNQIRKAEKSGLVVERGGAELVGDFYDGVRAQHARPRHAGLFAAVVRGSAARVSRIARSCTSCASRAQPSPPGFTYRTADDGAAAVGLVDSRLTTRLCPNVLLYWDAIQFAQRQRCADLSTWAGRRPNEGTFKFKAQWGAEPVPLHWEYQLMTAAAAERQPGQSEIPVRDRAVAEAAARRHDCASAR